MKLDRKTSLIVVLLICATYTIITIAEIKPHSDYKYPDYRINVWPYLYTCSLDQNPFTDRAPLKWYSICASYKIFGNENIIPFLFSLVILPLTYRLGWLLTNKHLVGLIALVIVVTSISFTRWDTSATYDQSWAFFLILALNMTHTKYAPLSYIASIASKTLAFAYLPMYLYQISRQKEQLTLYNLTAILVPLFIVFLLFYNVEQTLGTDISFDINRLYEGSWKWLFYFADDLHIMIGTPVMLAMLYIMKSKIRGADVVFWWCTGIILTVPLIMGFTTQLVHPYRFVPFTIFFGIGVGMVVNHFAQKLSSKLLVSRHGLRTSQNNP